jgi:hypothetical protein
MENYSVEKYSVDGDVDGVKNYGVDNYSCSATACTGSGYNLTSRAVST